MRVAGLDVPIEFTEDDLDGSMGIYRFDLSTIRINDKLPTHTKLECVLHEVIECILKTNEIEMKHADLTTLSMTLYQVLRDNGGDISKWL